MRVTRIKFDTFIIKVARTQDTEVGCDDCARESARLIEAFMRGPIQDSDLLSILHHVLECTPCSQEFEVLKDCARMDAEDSWPSFDEMWNKIEETK